MCKTSRNWKRPIIINSNRGSRKWTNLLFGAKSQLGGRYTTANRPRWACQRRPGIAPIDLPLGLSRGYRLVFLFFHLPAFTRFLPPLDSRGLLGPERDSSECSGCCCYLISSGKFELLRIGLISLGGFTHFMLRVELLPPIRRFSLHGMVHPSMCANSPRKLPLVSPQQFGMFS